MSEGKEYDNSFAGEMKSNGDSERYGGDDVCRDFLNSVCNRGNQCRYRHPEGLEAREGKNQEYVFCHDHQNRECSRRNCKFVHASKEEEEEYKLTGRLPQYILDRTAGVGLRPRREGSPFGGPSGPYGSSGGDTTIPICKEFIRGVCDRAPGRCKFRHVKPPRTDRGHPSPRTNGYASPGPYHGPPLPPHHAYPPYGHHPPAPPIHHPVYHYPHHPPPPPPASNGNAVYPLPHHYPPAYGAHPIYPPPPVPRNAMSRPSPYDPYGLPGVKRRAYESPEGRPSKGNQGRDEDPNESPNSESGNQRDSSSHDNDDRYPTLQSSSPSKKSNSQRFWEEENNNLRRRVEDLKHQVQDLMTRNEFLLDQNAQLRASVAATGAVVAAAGGFPASISKGLHVPSSAAATAAAASVAAASSAAQQAVASAVAAAAAAGAGAAGLNGGGPSSATVVSVGQGLPTSMTVELPVSLPVFSAASGVPCVSSIASLLNSTTNTMSPIVSHVSSQANNSSAVPTHFVSYPIMSSPCVTANTLNPNSHHQMH